MTNNSITDKVARLLKSAVLPALFLAQGAAALEPPPQGYASRSASRSINPKLGINSEAADPALVANLYARVFPSKGARAVSRGRGLPAKGAPRMLVLLIDFDDYPARAGDTVEHMSDLIFGAGGKFPYESLSAYYRRSSRGGLEIRGDVLGWYRAGLRSEIHPTREGRDALVRRALEARPGHDYSQYDNNGDGVIDYLAVIWTGPTGDWATFWWGCATRFADASFSADGVRPGSYSWQPLLSLAQAADAEFSPRVLIHETGHSLGLPDYYDYQPGVGPDGGLGYFDMMDANRYDHNCFSKIMLGWVEPKVVTFDGEFSLAAAADNGDCVVAIPAGKPAEFFGEFYIVEKRARGGNDARMSFPGGIVVWHVDARLNERSGGFLYNNQTTGHKLIKFMEADGLEELEAGARKDVTAEDFFFPGGSFGAGSGPSALLYGGGESGVAMFFSGGGPQDSVALKYAPQPVIGRAEGGR
ncbi:MAG: M6 family metalloprotease domain-containing protein [Elusimicrobiota bacterium]|nr:M6 family metalloprotease domain-containing protein [Elusimicrobiota bacterium]